MALIFSLRCKINLLNIVCFSIVLSSMGIFGVFLPKNLGQTIPDNRDR